MGKGLSDIVPNVASALNFLLNIVGLLLWFNWRAGAVKSETPPAISLVGTLQKTEVIEPRRWFSFGCLLVMLIVRAMLYCQIGSQVNWIAALDVTAIALPFRSDLLGLMFLFSTLSFLISLGIVYAALLLLSVINTKSKTSDHFTRLVFLQLSWFGKLPWPIRLILGPLLAALAWMAIAPLFQKLGIFPAPRNAAHAWQIAGLISLCLIVSWKYVIALFLGLHLLNTYVYLGSASFWGFVALTGNRLCLPLRWIPLRIGKFDFAPAIVLVAAIWGSHELSIWIPRLYRQLPF